MSSKIKPSWFWKGTCGLLGVLVAGPIGGLIGLWIGAKFDKKSQRLAVSVRYAGTDEAVAAAVAALGGKLAKADGQVSSAEILAFRRIFNIAEEDVPRIGALWRDAARTAAGYEPYARHLSQLFAGRRVTLHRILADLRKLAEADGEIAPAERWVLEDIAKIFGLSQTWELEIAAADTTGQGSLLRAAGVERAFRDIFSGDVTESGVPIIGDENPGFAIRARDILSTKLARVALSLAAGVSGYASALIWLVDSTFPEVEEYAICAGIGAIVAIVAWLVLPKPRTLADKIAAAAKDANVSPDEVVATIEETNTKIQEIRRSAGALNERLRGRVEAICQSAYTIAHALHTDPGDVGRSRPFLMHYLDATIDVVERSAELDRRKGDSDRFDDVFGKLEPLLDDIEGIFKQHYERNLADDALQLDVSIDSLQQLIRAEAR